VFNKFYSMKKCTILFLLLYAINCQAQSPVESPSFLDKTEFKIGYYGNLNWNHGLNLGAEFAWKEKQKIKEKRNKQKTITHQLLLNGSLGFSTNFTNQTERSLLTAYGMIFRRTNAKRWQFNFELNPLGYYRSILPETLELKEGEVSEVKLPGRNYYAPSFAFGLGRSRKDKSLTGWYLNLNCALRTPYNAGNLPMLSLQYGYRFNLKKK